MVDTGGCVKLPGKGSTACAPSLARLRKRSLFGTGETQMTGTQARRVGVRQRLGLLAALLALLAALLPGAGPAQASAQAIRFEDYALEVVDYHLANGLRVLLAVDDSAPVVAVNLWYRVGGADDPPGRSGFAHLFEHMMFEGSENIPDGMWDKLLEPIGARNNAYTAADKTVYWQVAPANELPRILWMESDRMRSLQVTQASFENQRAVVIQEYNERVANAPYGRANARLFSQPVQGYPPYELPVIGSVEDLLAATLDEVIAFHDRYYKPNNATLAIVGDIDIAQAQALIQAYFGDIPAGEPVPSALEIYPRPEAFPVTGSDPESSCLLGTTEVLIDPQIRIPRVGMTVVGPPRGEPDYYALELLTAILSGGNASRLQRNIVQQGHAVAAFAGTNPLRGLTIFYAAALPNVGGSVDDVAARMLAEFAKIREEGVTEAELARVKRQIQVDTLVSYRQSVLNSAEWIQDATLIFGDPNSIVMELEMYEAVTVADVQAAAQRYLCDSPMNFQYVYREGEETRDEETAVVVTPNLDAQGGLAAIEPLVLPEEAIAALPEGTVTRSDVPAPLGDLTSNFPPFETFTLPNGLQVIFVAQREVPKLRLQLSVGGSNPAVGPEQQGIARLLADVITRGTVKRSADSIAEAIESVGGSISASAALEWTTISVEALTTDTTLAFDLLSDVARYATFPQQEFNVAQARYLTSLEADSVNPESMANRQFSRVAFGNHPYGYITTPETVASLTRDDVRAFYRTFYRPNNALLVIVGDLTLEEARTQTERAFGYWRPAEVPDYLNYPPRDPADTSVIYLVDRPNSEQATIQVGNIAINARNPDRYALEIVNSVLGSGSSSRLFRNLREEKGLTYGVYSRFARPNDEASFRVLGDFDQNAAGEAIREILAELRRIRTELVDDQELEDAKGKVVGGFALAMEDAGRFADQLAIRALTGVPIEELNEYLPRLEAVTAEEVLNAAAKYIDSESPVIIVVGNAELLEPQLAEIAPVRVVDGEGRVIRE